MRKIVLGLFGMVLAISAHGQDMSGAGFPPVACSSNLAGKTYYDNSNLITYTCKNFPSVGYAWGLPGIPPVFSTGGAVSVPSVTYNTLYSAAGTALPTCNTAAKGVTAVVSDATTPTFLGAYASGGAVVAPVLCNGTGWVTY